MTIQAWPSSNMRHADVPRRASRAAERSLAEHVHATYLAALRDVLPLVGRDGQAFRGRRRRAA